MLFLIKTRDYHSCLFCHHVSRSRSHLVRLVLFCYFHVVPSLLETEVTSSAYSRTLKGQYLIKLISFLYSKQPGWLCTGVLERIYIFHSHDDQGQAFFTTMIKSSECVVDAFAQVLTHSCVSFFSSCFLAWLFLLSGQQSNYSILYAWCQSDPLHDTSFSWCNVLC